MKKKINKKKPPNSTIDRINQEMQKPRMTESVRNGLKAREGLLTIERPHLDWKP